jgi:uncharacterized protein YcnI
MRRDRKLSKGIRLFMVTAVAAAVVLLGAGTAGAHVEVTPSSLPKGGEAVFSFSVPNEEENANTIVLEVTFPTKFPIASVLVKPMTGWTITTETAKLAKPITTDDGTVTEAVSKVTWTALPNQGLAPGQFDLFTVSAGPLPKKTSKLEFKALQTYSDGTIVRWIDPTVKGTPEPEHPAPTLTLTKATGGH